MNMTISISCMIIIIIITSTSVIVIRQIILNRPAVYSRQASYLSIYLVTATSRLASQASQPV